MRWLLALIALLAFAGCSDDTTRRAEIGFCAERHFHRSLAQLGEIDHQTPSAEAMAVLSNTAWRDANPCCVSGDSPVPCPFGLTQAAATTREAPAAREAPSPDETPGD